MNEALGAQVLGYVVVQDASAARLSALAESAESAREEVVVQIATPVADRRDPRQREDAEVLLGFREALDEWADAALGAAGSTRIPSHEPAC